MLFIITIKSRNIRLLPATLQDVGLIVVLPSTDGVQGIDYSLDIGYKSLGFGLAVPPFGLTGHAESSV